MAICNGLWDNAEYLIADESNETLQKGQEELRIALHKMPVVKNLIDRFEEEKPFEGITIAACLHVTKETANLCRAWKTGGATVYLTQMSVRSGRRHVPRRAPGSPRPPQCRKSRRARKLHLDLYGE